MVHSVPLADALADVGFLRSLLNRLPSINTPQKHDKAHMRDKGGDSRLKRASAGRMLMLGTDDRVIPGNEKPACGDEAGRVTESLIVNSCHILPPESTPSANFFRHGQPIVDRHRIQALPEPFPEVFDPRLTGETAPFSDLVHGQAVHQNVMDNS